MRALAFVQESVPLFWNDSHTALICDAVPGTPGSEICNGMDDNCDGVVDDGANLCIIGYSCTSGLCVPDQQCYDVDKDGFTTCSGDCNDNNPAINPATQEVCNGVDDDCTGAIDDWSGLCASGYSCGGIAGCIQQCSDSDGDGYTTCNGDCNDLNAAIHPGAAEVCNNLDDDCSGGTIDAGATCSNGGQCISGECINVCNPNPCTHPPGPVCDGTRSIRSTSPGTCTINTESEEGYACSYPGITIDCANGGQICQNGQCTAGSSSGCVILYTCVQNCGNDQTCRNNCMTDTDPTILPKYTPLETCVGQNCANVPPYYMDQCIQNSCVLEWQTCSSA